MVFIIIIMNIARYIVCVVIVTAIGEVVIEVGATCGGPGHHGIEAR